MPRGGFRKGAGRHPIEGARLPLSAKIGVDHFRRFNRFCHENGLKQWEAIERLIENGETAEWMRAQRMAQIYVTAEGDYTIRFCRKGRFGPPIKAKTWEEIGRLKPQA